jgi:hypothetical protein
MVFPSEMYFKNINEVDTITVHFQLSTVHCYTNNYFPVIPGILYGKQTGAKGFPSAPCYLEMRQKC